jgi:hypothetical protein
VYKTAWFSLILSIFAILPSAVSGIGIPLIFISQIVGGIAMAAGRITICSFSAVIAFINLEFISVFSVKNSLLSPSGLALGFVLLLPQIIGYVIFLRRNAKLKKS